MPNRRKPRNDKDVVAAAATDSDAIDMFFDEADGAAANADTGTVRSLFPVTATPMRPHRPQNAVVQPLNVYLRLRPRIEADDNAESADAADPIVVDSDVSVLCTAPQSSASYRTGELSSKFSFNHVFAPNATQNAVFDAVAKPLVYDALNKGQSGLVFAYGVTNSGKTYTIHGKDGDDRGIIPRTVQLLFTLLAADNIGAIRPDENADETAKEPSPLSFSVAASEHSPRTQRPPLVDVRVSFIEIYQEEVYCLLTPQIRGRRALCKLHQRGADEELVVTGVREVSVESVESAMSLLAIGQSNRRVAQTALNSDSSRSHSVVIIKLYGGESEAEWSRISIVDLAGSERTKRTQTTTGDARRKEATNINSSLLVLGRCLQIMRENSDPRARKKPVPFRDSKITHLFRDAFLGFGRTVMMANASLSENDYDETINALKYASIARDIRIVSRVDTHCKRDRLAASAVKMRKLRMNAIDEDEADMAAGAAVADAPSNDEVDRLLDSIFTLKQQVVALEARLAASEESLRLELVAQMESQAEEMEAMHKTALDSEQRRLDDVWSSKLRALRDEFDDFIVESDRAHRESTERRAEESGRQCADLQRALDSYRDQCDSLRALLAARDADVQRMRETVKDATSRCDELQAENERRNSELRSAAIQFRTQIDSANDERRRADAQWHETLQTSKNEYERALRQRDDAHKTENASLRAEVAALREVNAELVKTNSALNASPPPAPTPAPLPLPVIETLKVIAAVPVASSVTTAPVVLTAKRRVKKRSSSELFDLVDAAAVEAAILSDNAQMNGGGRKKMSRLSSALEDCGTHNSKTAPAASLAHALNEHKFVAIINGKRADDDKSAAPPPLPKSQPKISPKLIRQANKARTRTKKAESADENSVEPPSTSSTHRTSAETLWATAVLNERTGNATVISSDAAASDPYKFADESSGGVSAGQSVRYGKKHLSIKQPLTSDEPTRQAPVVEAPVAVSSGSILSRVLSTPVAARTRMRIGRAK